MSLSVLTNIAALESGSSLLLTQARLQSTLLQLSSGSRINSGADDAAGLAIVAGLGANRAALTQSAGNAESGIGLLRVADGALSQVTTLLDRAVTLATEAANGTLNSAQVSSAGAEYQAILQEIGDISATTTVNGQAVFSNSPSSIYVGDGTSYGATGDSFEVGALSLSSIGENPQTQVVSGPVVPVLGLPAAAINSVAGVYSLAASAAGDTFSGTLSIQIGGNGPVTQLTVAAGTTQSQVEALVNGNGTLASEGVLATLDGSGNLQITGPPSGTALNFAGTSLADAQTSTPFVPTATPATPATQAVSFLYEDNSLGGNDPITAGGTLTATFNGSTYQYTAPAGTVLNDILPALQTLFTGSGISVALSAAPSGNPGRYDFFFVFTGTPGVAGPISLTSSLVDVDNGGPFTAVAAAAGSPAAPPYTTYAFGNDTSVFSGNLAITAGVHAAVTVATAGLTGQQAAAAINTNATLQGYGVSATYDSASHKLAIYGNPDSTEAISAAGANGTIYEDPVLTSLSTTSAPVTGAAAHGATVAVTLGSYDDTVSGQLDLTLGSSGLPQDALSLTVAPGTTGQGLVNQINANAAFQTAGVTAAYNATTYTVTLTGPTGVTNTLTTTGTALIDTGGPNPLPGTSLAGALSSLTAANAAAVLQTVMSAVASVAYQRGVLGANVNQLTAYSAVVNAEALNLTAASNAIQATDYSATASDLAKYEVLSQTGVAALAQANGQARDVLRLLA